MASRVNLTQDKWLWLGLGAFLYVAVKGVAWGLRDILELNTIPVQDDEEEAPVKSQEIQDTIHARSLYALTKHPNLEIQNTATRILVGRLLKFPRSLASIAADLTSQSIDRRRRANYLLGLVLTESRYLGHNRRAGQRDEFIPLHEALKIAQARQQHLDQVCKLHIDTPSSNAGTNDCPESLTVKALLEKWIKETELLCQTARRSGSDDSPEEIALRRRRREAMVLNEGNRPVSGSDIIHPQRRASEPIVSRETDEWSDEPVEIIEIDASRIREWTNHDDEDEENQEPTNEEPSNEGVLELHITIANDGEANVERALDEVLQEGREDSAPGSPARQQNRARGTVDTDDTEQLVQLVAAEMGRIRDRTRNLRNDTPASQEERNAASVMQALRIAGTYFQRLPREMVMELDDDW